MKIGPVDTEMAMLIVKKEEITEGNIARSAGLPSGLNKPKLNNNNMLLFIDIKGKTNKSM